MKSFFNIYQYLAPLILTPLSFYLWWNFYEKNIHLTLIAWLIPILFAYIVPAIGTNILKVWEFNTKFRLGKFRPQHGFVFGSATSTIIWFCHYAKVTNLFELISFAFTTSCILGFINLIYDIKAIKSKILIVYNQPWADGKSENDIAMDYAPIFFAGFGVTYGLGIGCAEILFNKNLFSNFIFYLCFFSTFVISIIIPVYFYRLNSFRNYGHSGCKKVNPKS